MAKRNTKHAAPLKVTRYLSGSGRVHFFAHPANREPKLLLDPNFPTEAEAQEYIDAGPERDGKPLEGITVLDGIF